jgi:NAD-dependent dihydropyrimidine dehydrogenase PreA subunit
METAAKEKSFQTEVDSELCKACGYCESLCPVRLFKPSGKINAYGYNYMTADKGKKCIGCLRCLMICPDFAIHINEH